MKTYTLEWMKLNQKVKYCNLTFSLEKSMGATDLMNPSQLTTLADTFWFERAIKSKQRNILLARKYDEV